MLMLDVRRERRTREETLAHGQAFREACLCVVLCDGLRDKKKHEKPFTPWDYMPGYERPQVSELESPPDSKIDMSMKMIAANNRRKRNADKNKGN
jgi:hypothetical protein